MPTLSTTEPHFRDGAVADGQAPVVIAETDTGRVVLLAAADLEACQGSIVRLVEAIDRSALSLALRWPAP